MQDSKSRVLPVRRQGSDLLIGSLHLVFPPCSHGDSNPDTRIESAVCSPLHHGNESQFSEARPGVEPGYAVLQTAALPSPPTHQIPANFTDGAGFEPAEPLIRALCLAHRCDAPGFAVHPHKRRVRESNPQATLKRLFVFETSGPAECPNPPKNGRFCISFRCPSPCGPRVSRYAPVLWLRTPR